MKRDIFSNPSDAKICAFCESSNVKLEQRVQQFEYGTGADHVVLEAIVPVWSCSACEEEFTDFVAEGLRHEAVCRHLRRLTPREIVEIRKSNSLSQESMAELTGFGIASIKRWESGNQIQTESADRLLRVVRNYQGLKILQSLISQDQNPVSVAQVTPIPKFRTTITSNARHMASEFQLHRSPELQAA